MHGAKGDLHEKRLDVAYVPGVKLNLFSLQAVIFKCSVTLNANGAHMLGGSLSLVRRDTGSYLEATRVEKGSVRCRPIGPRQNEAH